MKKRRLTLEAVEQRIVLTAGTATIVNGELQVCGTAADDTIIIAELPDNFWVSAPFLQSPQLFAKSGVSSIKVTGGDGNDTIVATSMQTTATFEGNAGDDRIFGSFVADEIFGGPGIDLILANGGDDMIFAGGGNDRVFAGGGNDTICGGDGDDLIQGNDGDDEVRGEGGIDQLFGSGGNDTVYGGDDNDTLLGGAGEDTLFGGDGDDTVVGEGDNDELLGEAGNDTLLGGGGADQLSGGLGDDRLVGGNGDDELNGGAGIDTKFGDAGGDLLEGGEDGDVMFGGVDPDTLLGNGGLDTLRGGRGFDVLVAHAGGDSLFGGDDKDILIGGSGASLYGEGNEDYLINGTTNNDSDPAALDAMRSAWTSNESYALRVTDTRATYSDNPGGAEVVTGANGRDAFGSTGNDVQQNEAVGDQVHATHDDYILPIAQTISETVLSNDFVPNNGVQIAQISIVEQAAHGTVSVDAQGNFTYTQTTHGRDSFVYQITDTNGKTSQARVGIVVDGLPELPEGAVLTPTGTGLEVFDFEPGDGASPGTSATVSVGYVGYLPNGQIFDSNVAATFPLQNVIAGFREGIAGMNVGGSRRIVIPSDLGYGPNGLPRAGIGGEDSIIFDVILHSIV